LTSLLRTPAAVKIPNAERAVVDMRKIEGYCLNTQHPRGKHKARVFAHHGISEPQLLKLALLNAVESVEPGRIVHDLHGALYVLEFRWRDALIRSVWMVRKNEDFPRLVSCYIPKS
jgi:hypothetical protein